MPTPIQTDSKALPPHAETTLAIAFSAPVRLALLELAPASECQAVSISIGLRSFAAIHEVYGRVAKANEVVTVRVMNKGRTAVNCTGTWHVDEVGEDAADELAPQPLPPPAMVMPPGVTLITPPGPAPSVNAAPQPVPVPATAFARTEPVTSVSGVHAGGPVVKVEVLDTAAELAKAAAAAPVGPPPAPLEVGKDDVPVLCSRYDAMQMVSILRGAVLKDEMVRELEAKFQRGMTLKGQDIKPGMNEIVVPLSPEEILRIMDKATGAEWNKTYASMLKIQQAAGITPQEAMPAATQVVSGPVAAAPADAPQVVR